MFPFKRETPAVSPSASCNVGEEISLDYDELALGSPDDLPSRLVCPQVNALVRI